MLSANIIYSFQDKESNLLKPRLMLIDLIFNLFCLYCSAYSYTQVDSSVLHQLLIVICIFYAINIISMFLCVETIEIICLGACVIQLIALLIYIIYKIVIACMHSVNFLGIGWQYYCAEIILPVYTGLCVLAGIKAASKRRGII